MKPTKKAMREYLKSHFRYKRGRENVYANNIKVHHVLPYDEKYYQALSDESLMQQVFNLAEDFLQQKYPDYGLFTEGRSGGYLVLHARRKRFTEHKSYCKCCGQRNFRNAVELHKIPLAKEHPAWPMILEMVKMCGMSAGNPQHSASYFAEWAISNGIRSMSYFALFAIADNAAPHIVGKGSVLKCGKCGSPEMENFKTPTYIWESAGAICDEDYEIDEMDTETLIHRFNLVKAFDEATKVLIEEFKFCAEDLEAESEDEDEKENMVTPAVIRDEKQTGIAA